MKFLTTNRNAIRRTFVLRVVLSLQKFQNGKCCLFEFDDRFADKLHDDCIIHRSQNALM